MSTLFCKTHNPLTDAIKIVGVGKKGSKDLSLEMIKSVIDCWDDPHILSSTKGAFLGGLIMKGPSPEEKQMLETLNIPFQHLDQLIESIASDVPYEAKHLAKKLFNKEELTLQEAETLGDFLFSTLQGDSLRGSVASILRVRYETADEYEGLLRSARKTFSKPFTTLPPAGAPIIQLAEPFDGVDHSSMITPLIADYFQQKGDRTVSLVGRNSGPKLLLNLKDIAGDLNGTFLKDPAQLKEGNIPYGHFLDQADLSDALARWVDIRRSIIKRPFLSTIERFVNPLSADILVASAFHPPYGEKMLTLSERAGFKSSIIIRNGIEGTMAFALLRATKVLCSTKKSDGTFIRHEFDLDTKKIFNHTVDVEEKLETPSLKDNIALIKKYKTNGQTGNELFDLRVKATCFGLQQAIDWIKSQQKEQL